MKLLSILLLLLCSCVYSQLEKEIIFASGSYNPVDVNTNAFACHSRRNYVAIAPNKMIGIVYREVESPSPYQKRINLYYANIDDLSQKSIVWQGTFSEVPDMRSYLIYDNNSAPHIFVQEKQQYFHFQQQNNQWIRKPLQLNFRDILGKEGSVHEHKISQLAIGPNNEILVFIHVALRIPGQNRYRIILAENNNGDWQYNFQYLLPKNIQKIFHVDIVNSHNYTLLYSADSNLKEGEMNQNEWNENLIDEGGKLQEAGWEADCAYDSNGNKFVVSTYMSVVSTGSLVLSELRLHQKKNKTWSKETICNKSSNYHGGDGTKYTGASPTIVIDSQNHLHIIFNDIASWHGKNGNDFSEGNLRYMFYNGKKWEESIIYLQTGQSENHKTIHETLYPQIVLREKNMYFFAIERITLSDSTRFTYKPDMRFSIIANVQKQ